MKFIVFGSIILLSNSTLFAMEQKNPAVVETREYRVNATSDLDKLLIGSFQNLANLPAIKKLLADQNNLTKNSLDLAILAGGTVLVSALLDAEAKPSKYSRLLVYLAGYPQSINKLASLYPKIMDEVPLPDNKYVLFTCEIGRDFGKAYLWVSEKCPDLLQDLILWPLTVKLLLNNEIKKYQSNLEQIKSESQSVKIWDRQNHRELDVRELKQIMNVSPEAEEILKSQMNNSSSSSSSCSDDQ